MRVWITPAIMAAAGLACSVSTAALAQNTTNEAWIGQTGETNTISIKQEGISNDAGADNTTHRINQNGRFNILSIDQYGWSNAAGADNLDAPLPEGLNQTGNRNELSIKQHNEGGYNFVGAVLQSVLPGGRVLANILAIVQKEDDGSGVTAHRIGAVTQINTDNRQRENSANLTQTGGFGGFGNTIERVIQEGYANIANITQSVSRNSVVLARQHGSSNTADIDQRGGEQNTIVNFDQVGLNNKAVINQSGDLNHIALLLQNNQGVAISGNRMMITIAGDNNGGDGLGGAGAFKSPILIRSGAFEGGFIQMGDDNGITYTVNDGNENLAGIAQYGRGNGAIVTVSHALHTGPDSAARNEVGVVQTGDGNSLSVDVVGKRNIDSVTMTGDRNNLIFSQIGGGNIFDITLAGNDNNNSASKSVGGFRGTLIALASDAGLSPGAGLQRGTGNSVTVHLTGNSNLFAFRQQGADNIAGLTVTGGTNQSLVDQSGNSNQSLIKQSGAGNSMSIVQF